MSREQRAEDQREAVVETERRAHQKGGVPVVARDGEDPQDEEGETPGGDVGSGSRESPGRLTGLLAVGGGWRLGSCHGCTLRNALHIEAQTEILIAMPIGPRLGLSHLHRQDLGGDKLGVGA